NSDIDGLYRQLESQVATVAKGVSGDQGQRLQKAMLTAAEHGYLPDRGLPTATNVGVRNNFVKEVDSIVDTALGALPQAQKERIKASMGLKSIKLMKTDGSYVGQEKQGQLSPEAQKL